MSGGRSRQGSQKKRKQAVGYESQAPVCGSCMHYKKPIVFLRESLPQMAAPAQCKKHDFGISPGGCCDHWCRKTRKGNLVTLEGVTA